jgi:FeoA domain
VTVIEKHPFDGPLVVEIDGQTRTIGERVARQVFVTRRLSADEGRRVNGARQADTRQADAHTADARTADS